MDAGHRVAATLLEHLGSARLRVAPGLRLGLGLGLGLGLVSGPGLGLGVGSGHLGDQRRLHIGEGLVQRSHRLLGRRDGARLVGPGLRLGLGLGLGLGLELGLGLG